VVGVVGAGGAALSKGGQRAASVGLTIMLRTYFLQQWFNLSDPGMEEAFYDS
jgi:IS5 family transposase